MFKHVHRASPNLNMCMTVLRPSLVRRDSTTPPSGLHFFTSKIGTTITKRVLAQVLIDLIDVLCLLGRIRRKKDAQRIVIRCDCLFFFFPCTTVGQCRRSSPRYILRFRPGVPEPKGQLRQPLHQQGHRHHRQRAEGTRRLQDAGTDQLYSRRLPGEYTWCSE